MIRRMLSKLGPFRRSETGSATIEFVMLVPFFLAFLVAGAELSLITMRHAALERGVDLIVRDIRLGTGTNWNHDDIKTRICDVSGITDCVGNLRLQMIQQDAFTGIVLSDKVPCTDSSEDPKPVLDFKSGQSNELMILRACLRIDPILEASAIAKVVPDDTGHYAVTATTAFVQEPL
ncbi:MULTISPECIES: TadE/TadG family type IV pilus assembly protein [unclassified Ruegeria]|uniref:TadE/TadG family type IV pilus assembly protein n=1 Tax=unclassified Ruegeria TaxID=2625375 RepID=UPI001489856D|nr:MULTISPECIES: TadE family protein [unclassified Ruegeria]NOD36063.1 pilus assembly protein [Ruegeria sp. HKCCD7296]NOD45793.1 pilus assembly protein [Ruegeria sp. HKCCD5849]NOD50907.1 pilus assembly protein [Ruegeria sp. HKCCD5851]NOD67714.1 pilus assembly protein [Ruegeria sp. HKCCD7303]NOE35633.1 pilus assembly protein [Ruegeria sp. HKCCD7318]